MIALLGNQILLEPSYSKSTYLRGQHCLILYSLLNYHHHYRLRILTSLFHLSLYQRKVHDDAFELLEMGQPRGMALITMYTNAYTD